MAYPLFFMKIRDLTHPNLQIDNLTTSRDQSWCFYGENNSGINGFLQLLEGRLTDVTASALEMEAEPGILSFRGQQELFEDELRIDDTDFLDRIDPGTSAREYLGSYEESAHVLKAFNFESCLDTGIRQLSSGQNRKLIILKELIRGCDSLILQNPFDGLDVQSCVELNDTLAQLTAKSISIIILVNSVNDIPLWCSHLGVFTRNQLSSTGTLEDIKEILNSRASTTHQSTPAPLINNGQSYTETTSYSELICLKNGFAGYGGKPLFEGLDLRVNKGDHTLIYGPNGCGKSTLLDIITGDNPKCYANDLTLFGAKRGCGESIWELKQKMGIISPSLHRDHRIPGTALHVVLSGLFDSIGLYEKVGRHQIRKAEQWLLWLGMEDKRDCPFRQLEFAEQRLVLIGRALIKAPELLIFDEATQGLDDHNRMKLLDLLDRIATDALSTILFVSHRTDEYRPFFTQKIKLDAYKV